MKIMTKEEALSFLLAISDNVSESDKPFVIAIDGRSASGKTSFAAELKEKIDISVIHTDDFFRPKNKYGEIVISKYSGNFDIDRFKTEAVKGMLSGEKFSVGIFDCKLGCIRETITYNRSKIFIVEGAYSTHPDLGKYWDISLFFDIECVEQKERILSRNGIKASDVFDSVWIPAEERYFAKYDVEKNCDITVENK